MGCYRTCQDFFLAEIALGVVPCLLNTVIWIFSFLIMTEQQPPGLKSEANMEVTAVPRMVTLVWLHMLVDPHRPSC